ncbi:GLPGLI family protein [Chryseobacterium wanjuense]
MRQKLLGFFVLFLVSMSYGQTTRYIYETAVNPDSINLVSMRIEKTFLDVKGSRSLFISENKLIKDSLFASFKPEGKEERKKDKKNLSKTEGRKYAEPTFFEYFIIKNIAEQKVYYYDRVGGKQIYYQEDRPLKWEISDVTEKQNGYPAQKAIAIFGGRIWTAWFTRDINISDESYKFSGLPGLIVKLEDDKGDYKFDLVKKITIQNAFEEPMTADAKQSTRRDFGGDKAALALEFNKNRKAVSGNKGTEIQDFAGGRRAGGMNSGGMGGMRGGHGGGMHREGIGGNNFPMQSSGVENISFTNGNQNPIELK